VTISVDFDGVLHRYGRGWADGTIYDPPMPGALAGLRTLLDLDAVFILTSREPEQVMPWLQGHGFDVTIDERCAACLRSADSACRTCRGSRLLPFWTLRDQLLVTNRKLPARLYLDDRAVRFTDWDQALADIARLTGP
jgi:hypothetical protein